MENREGVDQTQVAQNTEKFTTHKSVEITNKMQPCNGIYYYTVH